MSGGAAGARYAGAGRRRSPARGSIRRGTEAALLPDRRLGPGRGGPRAGDAAGGLARARPVRRPSLAPFMALPDRHEPLSERAARSRPAATRNRESHQPDTPPPPPPTRLREPVWLEPYPDTLLESLPDRAATRRPLRDARGDRARVRGRGSNSSRRASARCSFCATCWPSARGRSQRCSRRSEVAVNRALQRARTAIERAAAPGQRDAAPLPGSREERELVARFSDCFEAGDIAGVIALLTDDAVMTMPPEPLEYEGPDAIGGFL